MEPSSAGAPACLLPSALVTRRDGACGCGLERRSVRITVNGETRHVDDGATLDALLEGLGVRRDGTAVALNDDVVPRASHASTPLREGDRLEVIVAVAGG